MYGVSSQRDKIYLLTEGSAHARAKVERDEEKGAKEGAIKRDPIVRWVLFTLINCMIFDICFAWYYHHWLCTLTFIRPSTHPTNFSAVHTLMTLSYYQIPQYNLLLH